MILSEALERIAKDFQLDAESLIEFAEQDTYSGWDRGKGDYPMGSLWTVEGNVLYALVRALRPKAVMELGVYYGASTCHIASALQKNRVGKVVSVDKDKQSGSMVPKGLAKRINWDLGKDALVVLEEQDDNSLDFIYEDLDHTVENCQAVAELARQKLKPGGVLVAHDAMHFTVGKQVREGLEAGGITPKYYLIEPSDCGLAIWQKPVEGTVDD